MQEARFQPGVVATPAAITIPAYALDIGKILHAVIERDDHTHQAFKVLGSATAGDILAFVGIKDGAGNATTATTTIGNAGGGTDFFVPTSSAVGIPLDVAVTATKIDTRTISLSVSTEANDIVVLDYLVAGEIPAAPVASYNGLNS